MAEESETLTKQTLRTTALMLVPVVLFLGLLSAGALAVAPASPHAAPAVVEGDKSTPAPGEGDRPSAAPRSPRASAKIAPNKL